MQITLGDFNFIYQFNPIPSDLNKTIPTSFLYLAFVQKQNHLSPLRTLFARQQSNNFPMVNIFIAMATFLPWPCSFSTGNPDFPWESEIFPWEIHVQAEFSRACKSDRETKTTF